MNVKCIQNSLNLRTILFPVQWNPCLTSRIAKTIAITTELNNLFLPIFNLFVQNWHRFPTCKNWKESTKTLNRKKSLAFCPACIVTVQANKQCRLSCLFSTVRMYIKICIHFHKRQNRKKTKEIVITSWVRPCSWWFKYYTVMARKGGDWSFGLWIFNRILAWQSSLRDLWKWWRVCSYVSIDRVECYKVHLVYSIKSHGRQWPTSKEK